MDHHDQDGKGRRLVSALPARLCELVPAARGALAQAAADAYRAVPWMADMTSSAEDDPRFLEYSASDALVGSEIVGGFLPSGLIHSSLNSVLRDAAVDRSLLEHCGNFIAQIFTHDMGLKEELVLYLKEDIDLDVATALARFSVAGRLGEFLRYSEAKPTGTEIITAGDGSTAPEPPRLLGYSSIWDAPSCFLELVPEVAENFSNLVLKGIGELARAGFRADGPFDLVHAIVGRPIQRLVQPARLVREVVADVIDEAFRRGDVLQETIDGCCRFIAIAVEADKESGGHLLRVLPDALSVEFSRIALGTYRDEGEFRDVLLQVAARS